ncbi:hypothetical protein [Bradyrhizobium sp. Tv2a-2]|uniref:hypothetical protein n=1 Tax=Bradyrhizobium sp. Tv2a-2 TaxID=113395 RepID=UPI0003FE1CDE|nr:hypothetical protein [Bradyrhizobium sp. Tv2a-2]
MSDALELLRSRGMTQVVVLALISFGLAGCSADMSTRFSQNSYSDNPFAFDPQPTGSVQSAAAERRELPQYAPPQSPYAQPQLYQTQPLLPPAAAPQPSPTTSFGRSAGGQGVASN